MTAHSPELSTISVAVREASGYAIIGKHGHGRVAIRILAAYTKGLNQYHATAARVLVEHDTLIPRLGAGTDVVRGRNDEQAPYTRARLEQFVRDAYTDLIARRDAGDPAVLPLFAPVTPREVSDAVTVLGTTGWRGASAPTTLPVQA